MIVEPTITAGNLLTIAIGIVVWVITLSVAWTKLGGRLDMVDYKIGLLEKAVENIGDILKKFNTSETDIVILKRELANLQQDYTILNKTVEDLRRGTGWITGRRESVDGIYPKEN